MPPNEERKEDKWGMGQLSDGEIVVLTPEEAAEFIRKRNEEEAEEDESPDEIEQELDADET